MIIRKVTPLNSPNTTSQPIDLEIEDGKIIRLGPQLDNPKGFKEYAFENALMSKGWVDLHVHVYFGATDISIRPEQAGLETGVTTLVDCGSAGEANFVGFSEFIAKQAKERLFAFLNIGSIGLVACNRISELSLGFRSVNVERTLKTIENYPDLIRGIKCRASQAITGDLGAEAVRVARKVARVAGLPLIVHVGEPPPLMEDVLDLLEEGDVVTHAFHGKPGGNLMEDPRSLAAVHEARIRGVLLDVGHGAASFSFKVMRFAREQGIETDLISTDLHRNSIKGPAYDLPTTLSKLLNLGMPLEQVIAAGSTRPSSFLDPTEGEDWLKVGKKADLTVFRVDQANTSVEDSLGDNLTLTQLIHPLLAIQGVNHAECGLRFQ
ncbi:MAG: amidohydrolase/deacetylase family metallohydrolase [Deltaproteobacteria bacterium]|jgi:dihydroorotase|nr:amidohydrolase/deacetylase family metallohydrolase [Deltaproteobacteria bacterium]